MSLSIKIRRLDFAVVLELSGRFSVLEQHLQKVVWELIEGGNRNFVINVANVSYLDSSGLGQLCLVYTMLQNHGGSMKLLGPTPRIRELLRITKLDTVFEWLEQESDADASTPTRGFAVSA